MKTKLYFLFGIFYVFTQLPVLSQGGYLLWVRDQDMDAAFIDTLVNRSIDVHVKTEAYRDPLTQTQLDSLNGAQLIVMSRSTKSDLYDDNPSQWNGFTAPLICLSPWLLRNTRWSWFDAGGGDIDTTGNEIMVLDTEDPIFEGYETFTLDVYADTTEIIGVASAGNGKILATSLMTGNIAIASWEAGQEFYAGSGQTAGNKRIFFAAGKVGTPTTSAEFNLTETGKDLFVNAVLQFFHQEGIEDNINVNSLSIYPNPASEILQIDFQSEITGNTILSIIDVTGREVFNNTLELTQNNKHFEIDISNLPNGIYMFRLSVEGNQVIRKFEIR